MYLLGDSPCLHKFNTKDLEQQSLSEGWSVRPVVCLSVIEHIFSCFLLCCHVVGTLQIFSSCMEQNDTPW